MYRIKLLFLSAIIQMLPAICVAELPQDLDEVLFGLSGCVDYSQWVRTVGVIKFRTPIGIFKEAEFSSRQERPEWEPTHSLIQMHSILNGSESFSNAVSSVKGVESTLLEKLGHGGRIFSHDEFANSYSSVCTNIDGCGWTAKFTVKPCGNGQEATQPCMVTAEFNKTPLNTNTCEDLFFLTSADAWNEQDY